MRWFAWRRSLPPDVDFAAVLAGDPTPTPDAAAVQAALTALARERRDLDAAGKALRSQIRERPNYSGGAAADQSDPGVAVREEALTALAARRAAIDRAVARLRAARRTPV
jgi:tRNA pseudouridine-54 N-methylase